jgi:hypothetical protein
VLGLETYTTMPGKRYLLGKIKARIFYFMGNKLLEFLYPMTKRCKRILNGLEAA